MVTRTFFVTKVNALVANVEEQTIENKDFELFKKFKSEDKIIKAIREKYETNTLKILSIDKVVVEQVLMGMKNSTFIENSYKMENRKKVLKNEFSNING